MFAPNGVPNGTGLPGGCTRDLVHRFYQEQYQLNDGRQNRYVTGSDAVGLTMGVYDTRALPIYQYLHQRGHPHYAIADNFFQSAFGGSFLNHQWLIAARNPVWPDALNDGTGRRPALGGGRERDAATTTRCTSRRSTARSRTLALTASCNPGPGRPPTPPGVLCGDYAVNTIQPTYQPYAPGTPVDAPAPAPDRRHHRRPPERRRGRLGLVLGWLVQRQRRRRRARLDQRHRPGLLGPRTRSPRAVFPNCPDKLFQFHHQPFNYYASLAPGTAARAAHLRDEQEFLDQAKSSNKACNLKPVSFIKPVGAENEHPGYASATAGSTHLVELLQAIEDSRCAKDTMVVVTYDEFGGQWDHVTPPGQGGKAGPHDVFGPRTRIPALVISPGLRDDFVVDHTQYDTTSILATIERRFDLAPLSSRDAAVHDLSRVFHAK